MGWHRKSVYAISGELKSREYLAAGLPYVTIHEADAAKDLELRKYVHGVSNDDTNIDIGNVVHFYDALYTDNIEDSIKMAHTIRDIAAHKYNMKLAMKSVIDYFKEAGR